MLSYCLEICARAAVRILYGPYGQYGFRTVRTDCTDFLLQKICLEIHARISFPEFCHVRTVQLAAINVGTAALEIVPTLSASIFVPLFAALSSSS